MIIHFFTFVVLMVALVAALDSFWRVKNKLRRFVRWLVYALVFQAVAELMTLADIQAGFSPYVVLAASICFVVALVDLYAIIRELDNETPAQ